MSRIMTINGLPRLTILSMQLLLMALQLSLMALIFLRVERLAQVVERTQATAEMAFDMHGRTPRTD